MDINETITSRQTTHGDYALAATIKEALLEVISTSPNYKQLDSVAKSTIRMVVEKLGRVLCGDFRFGDHWHDIAGYATLAENYYNRLDQYLKEHKK